MSGPGRPLTELFVASSNEGKLRDFRTAAAIFQMPIHVLPGLKEIPAPEEHGATFEENARSKAEAYSRMRPGLAVLADDSGLEVDALGGEPGVRSARYAADAGYARGGGDADALNNLYLLQRLQQVGDAAPWTARYRCVLAVAVDGACLLTARGAAEGVMVAEARGEGGFGYDALFHLPDFGKTMAEVDQQTRQLLSHRGSALRALLTRMREGAF